MPIPPTTHGRPSEYAIANPAWGNRNSVEIIETCRAYLLMAANKTVGEALRVKVAPSDLVQETILAAVGDFGSFRGTSERELLAWLSKILSYRILDAARRFRNPGMDIGLEVSLDDEAKQIELSLSGVDGTPSALVIAEEEENRLLAAIACLEPEDQQLVRMRNWDQLTFEAIGQRLGLSESGVRKRWGLAIEQLRRRLEK